MTTKLNTAIGAPALDMTDDEVRKLIQYHSKILSEWAMNNFTATKDHLRWRARRIADLVEHLEESK